MSNHYQKKILVLAVAGLTSSMAQAQSEVDLDDVVVTAAGYEQQVKNAPASISVLEREELEDRYFNDVTDALRSIPGVIVTGGGAGDNGADISIRGMPSQYTLILVDGKPRATRESRPNGSAGFEQDWLPPLQAIERIEVIRGPMSTLYGSDAIGGVINIITRKVADEWHGSLQASTVIQDNNDSGNSQQTNVYLSGPLKKDLLGLEVYGQVQHRDEDDIVNGYEDKSLRSMTARLSLTPTANQEFTLEGGVTEQSRESNMGRSAPSEGCRGGCSDSYSDFTHEHVAVTHTGRWDIGTSDTYVQRETSENESREISITNTKIKSSLVMPLSAHIVTVGADYEEEKLEDYTTNEVSDLTEVDTAQWALFAEDEWLLTDSFSVTGGVRLDDSENYGSHISPRLYGAWNFTSQWTLKGGVSTGYYAPDLRDITTEWGAVSRGGTTYGNPDLEPETSLNKELGLLYTARNGMSAGITVFHNDFEDKITRVRCLSATSCPPETQYDTDEDGNLLTNTRVNVDEAVTQGVEISLSAPLTQTLDFSASYTYTDSEQKSGEYEGEPLTQLPKHQATAGLDWQATQRLSPWARITYRGEESQPTTGPSSSATVAPSYTFVDTGIGYQLTEQAEINVGVYNFFDEDVTYEEYGYIEDGRRYWVGLNVNF